MLPTRDERKALAQEFASDVHRMRECLQAEIQVQFTDDELVRTWTDYSDGFCAVWLALPSDDATLLSILRKYFPQTSTDNPAPGIWHVRIQDAGDGTGDGIVELPDRLMSELGWKVDDKLSITLNDAGAIVLRKLP